MTVSGLTPGQDYQFYVMSHNTPYGYSWPLMGSSIVTASTTAQPAAPFASRSRYLTDYDFVRSSDLSRYEPRSDAPDPNHALYAYGRDDAQRLKDANQCGDFMSILYFGHVSRQGPITEYGGYGVRMEFTQGGEFYLPDKWVIGAGYQYAAGYMSVLPCATVKVVLGITNAHMCEMSITPGCTPREFGRLWGYVIKDTVDAVNRHGWQSKVYIWSGMDAEPDFGPFAQVDQLIGGTGGQPNDPNEDKWGYSLVARVRGHYSRNYIFGSAESGIWADAEIAKVNSGYDINFSLPQIYTPGTVDNWIRVKQAGIASGNRVFFDGALSGCPAGLGGQPFYPAAAAWNALRNALTANGMTGDSMKYSSVINAREEVFLPSCT